MQIVTSPAVAINCHSPREAACANVQTGSSLSECTVTELCHSGCSFHFCTRPELWKGIRTLKTQHRCMYSSMPLKSASASFHLHAAWKLNFKQICINGSSLINSRWGSFHISDEQDMRENCKPRDLISSLMTQWAAIKWEWRFTSSSTLSSLWAFCFVLFLNLSLSPR